MQDEQQMPLGEILDFQNNTYALTNAIIKRATQLSKIGGEEVVKHKGKVVSLAMREIFQGEVSYHLKK